MRDQPAWEMVTTAAHAWTLPELQAERARAKRIGTQWLIELYDQAIAIHACRLPWNVLIEHLIIWEEDDVG